MSPRVSLLIAAHNEGPALRRTILSALAATLGLETEIIVADDASVDGAPDDVAHEFPQVRLVRHPERRGAAPTKHLAAQHARGDILLFLDGHTHPEPTSLRRLVEDIDATHGDAIITPAVPHLDVATWTNSRTQVGHGYALSLHDLGCRWIPQSALQPHPVGRRTLYESPALIGCALAVSRKLYEGLWGFDAHMRSWGVEDLDFGLKAWLSGHPILHDPEAVIGHRFRKTFDNFTVPTEHLWANQLRMARKHFTDAVWTDWVRTFRKQHDKCGCQGSGDSPDQTHPEGPWALAWETFQADRPSLEQERAHLLSRRQHDEFWFAHRFGLEWPRLHQHGHVLTKAIADQSEHGSSEAAARTASESGAAHGAMSVAATLAMQPSPSPSPAPSPSPSPCPCEIESVSGEQLTFRNEEHVYTVSGECLEDAEISWSASGGTITPAEDGLSATVLWLTTSLANSVTASCGDSSATLAVKTYHVEILLNGSDVTGRSQRLIVGQKAGLEARVLPSIPQDATYQWSLPGYGASDQPMIVKGYTVTRTTGSVQSLTPQDLTQRTVTAYWVARITGQVTLTVSIGHRSTSRSFSLEVDTPSDVSINVQARDASAIQIGTDITGTGQAIAYGAIGSNPPLEQRGIVYQGTLTAPAGGSGQIAFVQLIRSNNLYRTHAGPVCRRLDTRLLALPMNDRSVNTVLAFYKDLIVNSEALQPCTIQCSDGPRSSLPGRWFSWSQEDSFQVYLMYRPNGADSIWVTTHKLRWGIKMRAVNLIAGSSDWIRDEGNCRVDATPTGTSRELPEWDRAYGDLALFNLLGNPVNGYLDSFTDETCE